MQTVFKVGMEVWDKTISPKRGKVIEVFTDYKYDFPIKVEFENNVKVRYTTDGCFVKNKGTVPTLSTSDYSVETKGFEQKAPAPTYEEVIKEARSKGDYYYLPDSLETPSEELVDATIALLKLLFLRDYYNDGWQPKNSSYVYIITTRNRKLVKDCLMGDFRVLYFKSQEISNRFFEEQRELLEIAKPLL
ncbi:hypothetical protein [Capnocytophaga sputigena]